MIVFQFIKKTRNEENIITEVYTNYSGRYSLRVTDYSQYEILDFNVSDYDKEIGIEEFDSIRVINKTLKEDRESLPIIIRKLEKIDEISKKKWLSQFPSHFPNEIWNGHWEREESLLRKELDELERKFPIQFRKAVNECSCKKYYMSINNHSGRIGLDTERTPQGGGTIAQSDNEETTLKIAFEVYGINKYFIN